MNENNFEFVFNFVVFMLWVEINKMKWNEIQSLESHPSGGWLGDGVGLRLGRKEHGMDVLFKIIIRKKT